VEIEWFGVQIYVLMASCGTHDDGFGSSKHLLDFVGWGLMILILKTNNIHLGDGIMEC
jgi:hypothetical protein